MSDLIRVLQFETEPNCKLNIISDAGVEMSADSHLITNTKEKRVGKS